MNISFRELEFIDHANAEAKANSVLMLSATVPEHNLKFVVTNVVDNMCYPAKVFYLSNMVSESGKKIFIECESKIAAIQQAQSDFEKFVLENLLNKLRNG